VALAADLDVALAADLDVALAAGLDVALAAGVGLTTTPLGVAPVVPYVANGVNFDGTNDFLSRGGDPTGSAASKLWTGSLWFKINNLTVNHTFYIAQTGVFGFAEVRLASNGFFVIEARQTSGASILQMFFSGFTDTASWHHILWSADLTNPARRHFILDDVEADEASRHLNFDIDFLNDDHLIGARDDATNKAEADVADFWMLPGTYLDFSIEANRRLFRTSGGKPVDLGVDGSGPTGGAPLLYFSGPTDDWHTNKGTGGGFTETGALTDATSSPSD